eukprot:1159111-Pelagomonas_calceolata.AAC.1
MQSPLLCCRQALDDALASFTYQVETRLHELDSQASLWKSRYEQERARRKASERAVAQLSQERGLLPGESSPAAGERDPSPRKKYYGCFQTGKGKRLSSTSVSIACVCAYVCRLQDGDFNVRAVSPQEPRLVSAGSLSGTKALSFGLQHHGQQQQQQQPGLEGPEQHPGLQGTNTLTASQADSRAHDATGEDSSGPSLLVISMEEGKDAGRVIQANVISNFLPYHKGEVWLYAGRSGQVKYSQNNERGGQSEFYCKEAT